MGIRDVEKEQKNKSVEKGKEFMRVIFGSYSSISALGGGVETQVRSLATVLSKLGVEVELFNPWIRYKLADFDFFHLFGAHVGTYHLGRSINNLGIKLILTPVFYTLRRPNKLKMSLKISAQLRKYGGFWTEHMFCKELCDMAVQVLVNTAEEKKLLVRAFGVPETKINWLPNGVAARFADASPDLFVKQFGMRDFILYVGHVGWGRKNLLPLLKVLKKIRVPTVIIGPVIQNEYGYQCLKLIYDTPFIKLIPGLPSDSPILESAYAACDTFVLPSLYETPGLAALEAGLAGAKVCITKYGGTREYFANYATYLDPRSERSIEIAIKESLNSRKSSLLRQHIKENFLWERCGERLVEIYNKF